MGYIIARFICIQLFTAWLEDKCQVDARQAGHTWNGVEF